MLEGDCRQERYLSLAVTITGNVEDRALSFKELRCCSSASCCSHLASLCLGIISRALLCASAPDVPICPTREPAGPWPSFRCLVSALPFPLFFAMLLPQEFSWHITRLTSLPPLLRCCASAPAFTRSFRRPSPSTCHPCFNARVRRSAPMPLAPLPSPRSPLRFFLHFSECHTLRLPGCTTVSP